jgi:peptidoglycan-N-acetylglucosamine deacetylase
VREFIPDMNWNPVYAAMAGAAAAGGVFAWSAMVPSAQLFGPTTRHTGEAKSIGLTFDDGPNPKITPSLLHLLDRYEAPATFFLVGKHVREFSSLAKDIAELGHTIGNHTDTHPSLTFLSRQRIAEELDRCEEAIEAATGRKTRWMRPPYGFRGPQLNGVVKSRGAGVVMWSVTGYDWKPQPAGRLIERLRKVRGGDIVLLHDADHRIPEGDRWHTVDALAHWLPRWKDAGLRFAGLDDLRG